MTTTSIDRSLKGSIDHRVLPLCNTLNSFTAFRTLSSCSGRIVLFLQPKERKQRTSNEAEASTSNGGDGDVDCIPNNSEAHTGVEVRQKRLHLKHVGCLLKVSHEPIDMSSFFDGSATASCTQQEALLRSVLHTISTADTLGCSKHTKDVTTLVGEASQGNDFEVILKMEPVIVHVCCESMDAAEQLLAACTEGGLQQSGVLSVKRRIVVAIRGSQLFECPVAVIGARGVDVHEVMAVIQKRSLVYFCDSLNRKMYKNFKQMERLLSVLQGAKFSKRMLSLRGAVETPVREESSTSDGSYKMEEQPMKDRRSNQIVGKSRSQHYNYDEAAVNIQMNWKPLKTRETNSMVDEVSVKGWGFATAYCAPYVFVFGGIRKWNSRAALRAYNTQSLRWIRLEREDATNYPPGLVYSSLLTIGGRYLVLIGGRETPERCNSEIYIFDCIAWCWVKPAYSGTAEGHPTGRWRHASCVASSSNVIGDATQRFTIYTYGGVSAAAPLSSNVMSDLWKLEIDITLSSNSQKPSMKYSWKQIIQHNSFDGPGCVHSHSMLYRSYDNSLFLFGGHDAVEVKPLKSVYIFELNTSKWTCYTTSPSRQSNKYLENPTASTAEASGLVEPSTEQPLQKTLYAIQVNEDLKPKSIYPAARFSFGCTVVVDSTKAEYAVIIGGCGCKLGLPEAWMLNLVSLQWYWLGSLPDDRSYIRCSLVTASNWMYILGGGCTCSNFGTWYDAPLIGCLPINMFEQNKCTQSGASTSRDSDSNDTLSIKKVHMDEMDITMKEPLSVYIRSFTVQSIKGIKRYLESNGLYDGTRKIFKYSAELKQRMYRVIERRDSRVCVSPIADDHELHGSSFIPIRLHREESEKLLEANKLHDNMLDVVNERIALFIDINETTTVGSPPTTSIKQQLQAIWESAIKEYKGDLTPSTVKDRLPIKYERLGKIVLFSHKQFVSCFGDDNIQGKVSEALLSKMAAILNVETIGLLGITEGAFRQSHVQLLYGNKTIATVKENNVMYSFDVTKCMFSSGNTSERRRISDIVLKTGHSSEVVVDMFCGIGYFSIPLLVSCPNIKLLYGCDWNANALQVCVADALHICVAAGSIEPLVSFSTIEIPCTFNEAQ